MRDIDMYNVRKKDGTVVNDANGINSDGSRNVSLTGSNGAKANVDATGSLQVKIAGADDTSSGALGTNIKSSEAIVPVDIQNRLSQTIQTHNAVSVGASATSANSGWIDCDGFDKLGVTFLNDASKNFSISILWSNDAVSQQGGDMDVKSTGTNSAYSSTIVDVKARYAKVSLYNTDTIAHTVSAWAYLKA
jgi:hypothetical protein